MEGTLYRDAILYNYKHIAKNIRYDDAIKQFFKEEELNRFFTQPELSEGEKLVRYFLAVSRDNETCARRFVDALKTGQKPLADVIEVTKTKAEENLIDVYYRDGIMYRYNDLTSYLKYDDIIGELVQNFLVTLQEKEDIDAALVGPTSKSEKLLNIILTRDLRLFLHILKKVQKSLADAIDGSRQKIVFGEVSRHLDALAFAVKEKYKLESFYKLERLPGESFILDISNDHGLLTQDITALFLDKDDLMHQTNFVKEENLQYNYVDKEIHNIEDVFTPDYCENLRLVLCTGDAGIGKSVTLRRLAWQWSVLHDSLKQFKLLFVITLGSIKKSASLLDILADTDQGMGYIKKDQKNSLHEIFENNGEIVLIAIDADGMSIPTNSDLAKLISGELYSRVKVFVFCRPEANISGMKGMEKADAKLTINGTNDESIHRFIAALYYKSKPEFESGENVPEMLARLNLLPDKTLLYIPLYLTILAIIFNTQWVKHAHFSDFCIPKTMTQMFNAFLNVIIRKWQPKSGATDKTLRDFGTQNPMDVQSNVSVCILAKLFNIGRMSLDLLERQQFYVTEDDLKYFLIEVNDIIQCGLFVKKTNSGQDYKKEQPVFYFRHQLFQEYLAALYLSRIEMRDSLFKEKVFKNHEEPIPLEERFKPLQDCVKFLFGLNPMFGTKILNGCKENTALAKSSYFGQTEQLDLVYESEIIRESNEDPEVLKSLEAILSNCNSKSKPVLINNYENAYSVLFLLCRALSEATSIKLLKDYYLYDIDVQEKASCIILQHLDITCFGLLSRFRFPKAEEVTVHSSLILDFQHLQQVFPNVKALTIEGQQLTEIPHSSDEQTCNSLRRLEIVSKNITKMPLIVLQSLMEKQYLEELIMNKMNIFSSVKTLNEIKKPKFSSLTVFEYKNVEMFEHYKYLFYIFDHTPNLSQLILHSSDKNCTGDEADLFIDVFSKLTKIQHLELVNVIPPEKMPSVLSVCGNLPLLLTLGFDDICVNDSRHVVLEHINLQDFKKLKVLKVYLELYTSENFVDFQDRNINIEFINLNF